ncbi:MAG: glycosyltransferase involved in cell wall biosynthesis [Parasphingorhabdus sp.]
MPISYAGDIVYLPGIYSTNTRPDQSLKIDSMSKKKPVIAIILKGYPRLSETFIAQEIKALEDLGFNLRLISLRHPTDKSIHPIHREITAPVNYLPEYLYQEPLRVLKALFSALRLRGFGKSLATWLKDLRRDFTPNRVRRFGQAMVLARELPSDCKAIYAHFLHTPGSVARYAALMTAKPWSFSAHAKDIWTLQDWEKTEKLADCAFGVTCTQANFEHLRELADKPEKVTRIYHGLDFKRFPEPTDREFSNSGNNPDQIFTILSVGRAVAKKGYDTLLQALSQLSPDLNWKFVHIGGGTELSHLKSQAEQLGITEKIEWRGPQAQEQVLQSYISADLFVLASVVGEDGDRDGLPNVLMEAQSQKLCCLSTLISGIPELIKDGETGRLVPPADPNALANALTELITDPNLRRNLAEQGLQRLRMKFSMQNEIGELAKLLEQI